MKTFKVVDIRDKESPEVTIKARTPEHAVTLTLGIDAVRGSSRRISPAARVYWHDPPDQTNMVRLYERVGPK